MNDKLENKLGMLLKVQAHLVENNATYTTITGYTALKGQLSTAIDNIFLYNGIVETDITGSAEAKAERREILVQMLYKVQRGLAGYAAVNGDEELLRVVDFTASEISAMRDAELYTNAAMVSLMPDDLNVWDDLAPFHLTPDDIDNLNTAKSNYLTFLPRPGVVEAKKSAALIKLEKAFKTADGILKDKLDYMAATLASSFSTVYENYLQVRVIDDTGSYSPATHTGTANPGVFTFIASYTYNPGRSFRFKNNGTDILYFGLGTDQLAILDPGVNVPGGSQSTRLTSNLAPTGDNLLVQNDGTSPVDFSIWVIEP